MILQVFSSDVIWQLDNDRYSLDKESNLPLSSWWGPPVQLSDYHDGHCFLTNFASLFNIILILSNRYYLFPSFLFAISFDQYSIWTVYYGVKYSRHYTLCNTQSTLWHRVYVQTMQNILCFVTFFFFIHKQERPN